MRVFSRYTSLGPMSLTIPEYRIETTECLFPVENRDPPQDDLWLSFEQRVFGALIYTSIYCEICRYVGLIL